MFIKTKFLVIFITLLASFFHKALALDRCLSYSELRFYTPYIVRVDRPGDALRIRDNLSVYVQSDADSSNTWFFARDSSCVAPASDTGLLDGSLVYLCGVHGLEFGALRFYVKISNPDIHPIPVVYPTITASDGSYPAFDVKFFHTAGPHRLDPDYFYLGATVDGYLANQRIYRVDDDTIYPRERDFFLDDGAKFCFESCPSCKSIYDLTCKTYRIEKRQRVCVQ